MNKIAIIDIDGVVADSTARFAKAEEAKAAYLAGSELNPEDDFFGVRVGEHTYQESDVKRAMDVYWKTAFTPNLVKLDTMIEGVPQAIQQIELAGYQIVFLTSRPESMRQATIDWFWSFSPDFVLMSDEYSEQLIMKPPAFQFTKTIVWKAGTIQMLAHYYGADTVLAIDDEENNLAELSKYDSFGKLFTAHSLSEAIALLYRKAEE